MTFEEYQEFVKEGAFYPDQVGGVLKDEHRFVFPALGLAGETGEVVDKVKKIVRDQGGVINEAAKNDLIKELGDILWYLAAFANELDITLEEIAKTNIDKVGSRRKRGTLKGSGDNR